MRATPIPIAAVLAALTLAACGTEGVSVPEDDPSHEGAVLFSERCGGCHTFKPAGTQGSGTRAQRNQGPNFDERRVTLEDALFAIRNGGFSGAIMPQNIVVGDDAEAVAAFLSEYSGAEFEEQPGAGGAAARGAAEGGAAE